MLRESLKRIQKEIYNLKNSSISPQEAALRLDAGMTVYVTDCDYCPAKNWMYYDKQVNFLNTLYPVENDIVRLFYRLHHETPDDGWELIDTSTISLEELICWGYVSTVCTYYSEIPYHLPFRAELLHLIEGL